MMAVFGVILYLIYLAVCIALAVMGLTLAYMPYVLGGIASLIIYSQNPGIQTWIPGHPWMCFIVLLALVEAGIAVLMHIKHVSRAVITFFCCVFMGAIGARTWKQRNPCGHSLWCAIRPVCSKALRIPGGRYLETVFCRTWTQCQQNRNDHQYDVCGRSSADFIGCRHIWAK